MSLNQILERSDVSWIFTLLTLWAFFLSLYVMQLTSSQDEDKNDSLFIQWGRRISLAAIALSMLWSLTYSITKQWQPWPPSLGLLFAVILMLTFRILAIKARIRRDGRKAARTIAFNQGVARAHRVARN
jgi:cell division protein FtsW (lipid II flippase)